jgi:uncharacterized protein with GYD domain
VPDDRIDATARTVAWRPTVPHYLGQFTYHRKTWAALTKQPEDRAEVVARSMGRVDARLLSFYYCHGKYDGLMIFEAPDDAVAKAVAIAGIGAGHLKDLEVTRLLGMDEALAAMRIAGRGDLAVPVGVESALRGTAIHRRDETA